MISRGSRKAGSHLPPATDKFSGSSLIDHGKLTHQDRDLAEGLFRGDILWSFVLALEEVDEYELIGQFELLQRDQDGLRGDRVGGTKDFQNHIGNVDCRVGSLKRAIGESKEC